MIERSFLIRSMGLGFSVAIGEVGQVLGFTSLEHTGLSCWFFFPETSTSRSRGGLIRDRSNANVPVSDKTE